MWNLTGVAADSEHGQNVADSSAAADDGDPSVEVYPAESGAAVSKVAVEAAAAAAAARMTGD